MDQEIQDTKILPPILVPHKLLAPNNFKYHMQNVEQIISQSKEFESRQGTHLNFLQQTPKNAFDFQARRSNDNSNVRGSNNKIVLQSLNFQSSQPNLKQSYKNLLFNARNFGITQSHYFNPDVSSLHVQQRYGNSRSRKLKPIRKKEDLFFEDNLLYRPKRISNLNKQFLEQKNFQQIIKLDEFQVIVSFKGFQIELNGSDENDKPQKDRVFENFNFQDTHYLAQYSFEYINTFFTRCVSYNEARRKIALDWDNFQKIPYIKSSEQQNQIFPSNLYQDVANSNLSLELTFPQLNFYINDISHLQKYTCSQDDIKKLIENQFNNLEELLRENFDLNEARGEKQKLNNQFLSKENQRTQNFERRKSLFTQLKEQEQNNMENEKQLDVSQEDNDDTQRKIDEELKLKQEMEEQFNPDDKDLVNTITKMQANFKGKMFRKKQKQDNIPVQKVNLEEKVTKTQDDKKNEEFNPNDKELVQSVTKIQATFKGKKTRTEIKQLKQKQQENEQLQNQFKQDDQELVESITKIQAGFRGKKTRNQIKNKKKEQETQQFQEQFNPDDGNLINSVTKIQATWKGKQARASVNKNNEDKQKNNQQKIIKHNQEINEEEYQQEEEEDFQKQFNPQDKELLTSVTKIQASFKGKKARNEVKNLKQKKEQEIELQKQFDPQDKDLIQSVQKIQASFKGKQTRQQVKKIKQEKQNEQFNQQFDSNDKELLNSVTKIQASFKGNKARQQVKQLKDNTKNEDNNEVFQQQIEEKNPQNLDLNEQFNPMDKDLIQSVTKIQAGFKGKQARNQVQKIKQDKQVEEFKQQFNDKDKDLVNSVTKIQASFKGKQARVQIQETKKQKQKEEFSKQFNAEDKDLLNSVTKIQASFKGKQARSQVKDLKSQGEQNKTQHTNMTNSSKRHNNLNIKD